MPASVRSSRSGRAGCAVVSALAVMTASGHSRPGLTSSRSSHARYASDRYRNSEPLKPTRRAHKQKSPAGYSTTSLASAMCASCSTRILMRGAACGLAGKRYVGRMCNAACVDQDTRPPVRVGDAAPADALDLCFLLYRRLDCVDYAFCDLILQVEYAG
jgi:hypothetical protein